MLWGVSGSLLNQLLWLLGHCALFAVIPAFIKPLRKVEDLSDSMYFWTVSALAFFTILSAICHMPVEDTDTFTPGEVLAFALVCIPLVSAGYWVSERLILGPLGFTMAARTRAVIVNTTLMCVALSLQYIWCSPFEDRSISSSGNVVHIAWRAGSGAYCRSMTGYMGLFLVCMPMTALALLVLNSVTVRLFGPKYAFVFYARRATGSLLAERSTNDYKRLSVAWLGMDQTLFSSWEFKRMVPWYSLSLTTTMVDLIVMLKFFSGRFDPRHLMVALLPRRERNIKDIPSPSLEGSTADTRSDAETDGLDEVKNTLLFDLTDFKSGRPSNFLLRNPAECLVTCGKVQNAACALDQPLLRPTHSSSGQISRQEKMVSKQGKVGSLQDKISRQDKTINNLHTVGPIRSLGDVPSLLARERHLAQGQKTGRDDSAVMPQSPRSPSSVNNSSARAIGGPKPRRGSVHEASCNDLGSNIGPLGRADPVSRVDALGRVDALDTHVDSGQDDVFCFDFVADTGDGFHSTYAIASAMAQPYLRVNSRKATFIDTGDGLDSRPIWPTSGDRSWVLPRADVVIHGGDIAYPRPSMESYQTRFVSVYESALPGGQSDDASRSRVVDPGSAASGSGLTSRPSQAPLMFVIPGNHDWFDGLDAYGRTVLGRTDLGGWSLPQRASYYALRLPPGNLWVFAFDLGIAGDDMDVHQYSFFQRLVKERLGDNEVVGAKEEGLDDKGKGLGGKGSVIAVMHRPFWVSDLLEPEETFDFRRDEDRGNSESDLDKKPSSFGRKGSNNHLGVAPEHNDGPKGYTGPSSFSGPSSFTGPTSCTSSSHSSLMRKLLFSDIGVERLKLCLAGDLHHYTRYSPDIEPDETRAQTDSSSLSSGRVTPEGNYESRGVNYETNSKTLKFEAAPIPVSAHVSAPSDSASRPSSQGRRQDRPRLSDLFRADKDDKEESVGSRHTLDPNNEGASPSIPRCHYVTCGGGGAFLHPTHVPSADDVSAYISDIGRNARTESHSSSPSDTKGFFSKGHNSTSGPVGSSSSGSPDPDQSPFSKRTLSEPNLAQPKQQEGRSVLKSIVRALFPGDKAVKPDSSDQQPETGDPRTEVGDVKSEMGDPRTEIGDFSGSVKSKTARTKRSLGGSISAGNSSSDLVGKNEDPRHSEDSRQSADTSLSEEHQENKGSPNSSEPTVSSAYSRACSYPAEAISRAYAWRNPRSFRSRNWGSDLVLVLCYIAMGNHAVPNCEVLPAGQADRSFIASLLGSESAFSLIVHRIWNAFFSLPKGLLSFTIGALFFVAIISFCDYCESPAIRKVYSYLPKILGMSLEKDNETESGVGAVGSSSRGLGFSCAQQREYLVSAKVVFARRKWAFKIVYGTAHYLMHRLVSIVLFVLLDFLWAQFDEVTSAGSQSYIDHNHFQYPKLIHPNGLSLFAFWGVEGFLGWMLHAIDLPHYLLSARRLVCANAVTIGASSFGTTSLGARSVESDLNRSLSMTYIGCLIPTYWVLASLVTGLVFGSYLAVSVNLLGTHHNESFGSLRIKHYKSFMRFLVNRQTGEIKVYVVGINKVPKKYIVDPLSEHFRFLRGALKSKTARCAPWLWRKPSLWMPAGQTGSIGEFPLECTLVDSFSVDGRTERE